MARQARIIGSAVDIWGDAYDVRDARPTPHGFDVLLGWPHGRARGRGGVGGPKVIVTAELAAHMEAHRMAAGTISLPVGAGAIKRIRRLLGHHRQIDRAAWWEERAEELAGLTIERFARRHRVSVGAVVNARHALFGPKLRPKNWWLDSDVAQILLSRRPTAEMAEMLDISAGSVRRLRWALAHAPSGSLPVYRNREGRGVVTPEMAQQIVKAYHAGRLVRAIAAEYGVSKSTIYQVLRDMGVAVYRNADGLASHQRARRDAEIRAAYEDEGLTLAKVGERFGITSAGALIALRRAGGTSRPRKGGRRRTAQG